MYNDASTFLPYICPINFNYTNSMKKLVLIIATLYQSILSIQAQETETRSPFLFDEYKEGIVVLENRTQVKGKLNLYLPTGDFFFIDTTDGNKEKVLAKPEEVALIRFGSRVFVPSEDGGMEVLSTEPLFYVLYRAGLRDKGKNAAYGGTSALANIKSYTTNKSGTGVVSAPTELMVGELYNVYQIGKKRKEVRNMKQFLKLYSKQKELLQTYIDENDIHFDNALEMLQLVKYAHSLK